MSRRRRSDEGIRELEIAAHALLATVHGLAALWHLRRRNWRIGTIHAAAAAFDAAALITHLNPARETSALGPCGRQPAQ